MSDRRWHGWAGGWKLGVMATVILAWPAAGWGGEVSTAPPVEVLEGPPPGYEFVRLTPPEEEGIHSFADINDRGDVIWSFSIPPNHSNIHIFRDGRRYQLTGDEAYDVNPKINNHRDIALMSGASFSDEFDVLIRYNNSGAVVIDNNGYYPTINDSGEIAYSRDFSGDFSVVEMFYYESGEASQITFNALSNQAARINNLGELVWSKHNSTVSPWEAHIMYRDPNGQVQQLTNEPAQRGTPDINDCGTIVWVEAGVGIVTWDGAGFVPLTSQDERAPRINDHSDLFYIRWNDEAEMWRIVVRLSGLEYEFGDDVYTFGVGAFNNDGEVAIRGINTFDGWTAVFMLRRIAPKGDANGDCDIDFHDFAMMQHCFTGADNGPSEGLLADCTRADFDEDGDVDMADLSAFKSAFTGADQTVPDCIP